MQTSKFHCLPRLGLKSVRSFGFTLLELLVVLSLVAIASAIVVAAMPSAANRALDQEGQRLASILEVVRSYARVSGKVLIWQSQTTGFEILGLDTKTKQKLNLAHEWLNAQVQTQPPMATIVLNPEPILAAQQVTLVLDNEQITVVGDGVNPFEVQAPNDIKPPAQ